MPNADNPTGEPDDVLAQIARLREQVEALMKDRTAPPAGDAAACAGSTVCDAVKAMQQHAEELSASIRKQPLLSLLIAAGVGFVLGRALR